MTRHASAAAAVIATLVLGGATCPERRAAVSLAPAEGVVRWERAVEQWSRQHRVYEVWSDRMNARATYHSPALRKAFTSHRERFHGDFSNFMKRELTDLGGDGQSENFHSFFVASYVSWRRYDQLAHAHTIWTLTLESDNGARVAAEKVKELKTTPAVREVYPYVDDRYDRTYLVHFPMADREGKPLITAQTRRFTLRISSAYSEATLIWDLVPMDRTGAYGDYGLPRDAGPTPDTGSLKEEDGFGLGKLFGG
jgi:hypothetical protein